MWMMTWRARFARPYFILITLRAQSAQLDEEDLCVAAQVEIESNVAVSSADC
jgi:hypothetical protein